MRSLVSEAQDGNGTFVRNQAPTQALCSQAPACGTGSCTVSGNASANPFWDAGEKLAAQELEDPQGLHRGGHRPRRRRRRRRRHARADDGERRQDRPVPRARHERHRAVGVRRPLQPPRWRRRSRQRRARGRLQARVHEDHHPVRARRRHLQLARQDRVRTGRRRAKTTWPTGPTSSATSSTPPRWWSTRRSPATASSAPPASRTSASRPSGRRPPRAARRATTRSRRARPTRTGTRSSSSGRTTASSTPSTAARGSRTPRPASTATLADDGYTDAVDESLPPFNGHYDRGTAEELWAFLPPDMIAKLPLLMGSKHQYYVDGTAMVRDVWVDGTANGLPGAVAARPERQQGGRRVPHRRGGRRAARRHPVLRARRHRRDERQHRPHLPLDLPPAQREALARVRRDLRRLPAGRSADRAGPARGQRVDERRDADDGGAGRRRPVPYEERWVVLLAGGFDPQYVRGRGVFMLDVWTGKELFDFSYPEPGTTLASDDPRLALRFPIAATPGMVPVGPEREALERREERPLLRHRHLRRHRRPALGAPLQHCPASSAPAAR